MLYDTFGITCRYLLPVHILQKTLTFMIIIVIRFLWVKTGWYSMTSSDNTSPATRTTPSMLICPSSQSPSTFSSPSLPSPNSNTPTLTMRLEVRVHTPCSYEYCHVSIHCLGNNLEVRVHTPCSYKYCHTSYCA